LGQKYKVKNRVEFICCCVCESTGFDNKNIDLIISGFHRATLLLFDCFPGVTTHCGCIFTAR